MNYYTIGGRIEIKMILSIAFTLIISSFCGINGDIIGQPINFSEYASIEKDLIDFNLFRTRGDWLLRATSNKNNYYTRINFELLDDHVIFTAYINQKLVSNQLFRHVAESKIVISHPPSQSDLIKYLALHQDAKVMVYVAVEPNNQKTLEVLVRNGVTAVTTDDILRQLIHKLKNRAAVRDLIEPLLQTLEFVNRDIPDIEYEAQDFPISENDAVDCDFSNAVGNWTLLAETDEAFLKYDHANFQMTGNQIFVRFYDDKDNVLLQATWDYYLGSKVLHVEYYSGEGFQRSKTIIPWIDKDSFIQISYSDPSYRSMSVWSKSDAQFDPEYLKKVIDNQLLFSHDIYRYIKELVPKLQWKKSTK